MTLPHAPDLRSSQDTANRNQSVSGTSWILALALVALTVVAAIVLVAITT